MTTVFDAPMQDFSGDSTMDADMLPSATSETDWLQVENMMEDGELTEEIDMTHGDVQEFEMRDAGDAEFADDSDQLLPEISGHIFRPEPQDQEIPDASRAPSPSTVATVSQQKLFVTSVRPDEQPRDPTAEPETAPKATEPLPLDVSTQQNDERSVEPPVDFHQPGEEQVPRGVNADTTVADIQETSTLSGESTRSPHPEQQVEPLELSEPGPLTGPLPEVDHASQIEPTQEEDPASEVVDGADGHYFEPRAEATVENQVTPEGEESPLIEPPPSVLLSYSFDNSRFALFNLPEDPPTAHDPVHASFEPQSASREEGDTNETNARPTITSEPEPADLEALILIFRERFALYYEPLSLVFAALRAEETINVDGRFDDNVELVISVPELDLTLPEDNFHAKDVSLHDLGVLHTGCDLGGPLSLRLDTISPRFGSRYKAIRDEIMRVVSQQEEGERRSTTDAPEHLYTDDAPLHESPDHARDETLPEHNSDHNRPDSGEHAGETYEQSSENQTGEDEAGTHEHDPPDSHQPEEPEEQADPDAHGEVVSEEYVEYDQYDEDQAGDSTEEVYEDAEGEYAGEEEEVFEAGYEDAETQSHEEEEGQDGLDNASAPSATGLTYDQIHGSITPLDNDGPFATHISTNPGPTASMQHVGTEKSADARASDSGEGADDVTDPLGLYTDVQEEVTSQDPLLPSETFSAAEARRSSKSGTPLSADINHEQDEVIAYEDTIEDGDNAETHELYTLPTDIGVVGVSRALSTASKRSYDEHETEQLEGGDAQHVAKNETKRLRVD